MSVRTFLLGLTALAVLAPRANAHEGPPYPICVDEPVGPITLSIWADPDVGEGTFFYYVEPPLDGVRVEAFAQFQGLAGADGEAGVGELEARGVSADPDQRAAYQQIGTLPFERRGDWKMTFSVLRGKESLGQVQLPVEVTPPGLGRLYLLWYAIPFFAAAAIWLRMFLASRAYSSELRQAPESDDLPPDAAASGHPPS